MWKLVICSRVIDCPLARINHMRLVFFCLSISFLSGMMVFCLFEVNKHSPFGRDHKTAIQNQQQDFAPICFFSKFFQRLFLPLKMTQTGQGSKLMFTEDGEPYSNPISWINCINLFPNTVSQEHLVPSKFRFQGYVKMHKGEPWGDNHCCDKVLNGKAPI